MITDISKIPLDAHSYITNFLHEVLEPWTNIEGAETGDSQTKLLTARGYDDEINLGLMLLLDRSIRSMYDSEWFQDEMNSEVEPYDYYAQGVRAAQAGFEATKTKWINRTRQYGGQYGGAEAELWIRDYKPIGS